VVIATSERPLEDKGYRTEDLAWIISLLGLNKDSIMLKEVYQKFPLSEQVSSAPQFRHFK